MKQYISHYIIWSIINDFFKPMGTGPKYDIEPELHALRLTQEEAARFSFQVSDLTQPYIFRPLLISLTLMFFQQFSGANGVLFNLSVIFKVQEKQDQLRCS